MQRQLDTLPGLVDRHYLACTTSLDPIEVIAHLEYTDPHT
jgi:hypothetical protein